MKTIGIIIAIIVVVGVGAYLLSRSGNKGSNNQSSNQNQSGQDLSGAYPGNGVDQAQSGNTPQATQNGLMLQSVDMPSSGFVVIQADNNGQPGAVLGVSPHLNSGTNSNVSVPAMLTPGTSYFVTAYNDSAGTSFDISKNTPLQDSSGNVLRQQFTVPAAGSTSPSTTPGTTPSPSPTPGY